MAAGVGPALEHIARAQGVVLLLDLRRKYVSRSGPQNIAAVCEYFTPSTVTLSPGGLVAMRTVASVACARRSPDEHAERRAKRNPGILVAIYLRCSSFRAAHRSAEQRSYGTDKA